MSACFQFEIWSTIDSVVALTDELLKSNISQSKSVMDDNKSDVNFGLLLPTDCTRPKLAWLMSVQWQHDDSYINVVVLLGPHNRSYCFNVVHWKKVAAAAAAKLLQSCPTLCDPIDGSPPGSPVSGILQARTLEWVAISFSNAWKWKVKERSLSRVRPSETPWTAAFQAPPSMGFSRQEYWSGLPLPSPKEG